MKSLLPGILRRVTRDTVAARALAPLWNLAAGPLIGRQAEPAFWEGNSLILTVTHARWLKELTANEPELRARLCEALGSRDISRLVFRMP